MCTRINKERSVIHSKLGAFYISPVYGCTRILAMQSLYSWRGGEGGKFVPILYRTAAYVDWVVGKYVSMYVHRFSGCSSPKFPMHKNKSEGKTPIGINCPNLTTHQLISALWAKFVSRNPKTSVSMH